MHQIASAEAIEPHQDLGTLVPFHVAGRVPRSWTVFKGRITAACPAAVARKPHTHTAATKSMKGAFRMIFSFLR